MRDIIAEVRERPLTILDIRILELRCLGHSREDQRMDSIFRLILFLPFRFHLPSLVLVCSFQWVFFAFDVTPWSTFSLEHGGSYLSNPSHW